MNKNFKSHGALALFSIFLFSILACSLFTPAEENSSVISFTISGEMASRISSAAASRGIADTENLYLEISLKGGFSQTKTVKVSEGTKITFEEIPLDSEVYAEALAYEIETAETGVSERTYLYRGTSEKIKVKEGENTLNLAMEKIAVITFKANGGEITTSTQTIKAGVDQVLSSSETLGVNRDGYFFLNWNTEADGSGTQYGDETTVTLTEKITLYAQWSLYYGTKAPTETKAVGDIVFSDGSATPYSSSLSLPRKQKEAAIAVIFNTSDRTLGIGVKNSSTPMEWAKEGTTGYSATLSALYSTTSPSSARESSAIITATITGDTDGSDNWEEICKEDSEASSNMENYPVWQWVNNYGTNYSISGTYATGWYLPTLKECVYLYNSLSTVNSALEKVDGDTIPATIWTGNTSKERAPSAHRFSFSGSGAPRSWDNNGGKKRAGNSDQSQIAIKQF